MPAFYDSGVYVASAIDFVSGVMPYIRFTFVNPPGIVLLLAPVGVIGKLLGSHAALVAARWMGVVVAAGVAAAVPWLLRRQGLLAMGVAGILMATIPVADTVSSAIKLDTYCVLLSLIGAGIVLPLFKESLRSERVASWRWWAGGVVFGFAGCVKLWAVFPFTAVVLCLLVWRVHQLSRVITGAALGLLVPSLPFILRSPSRVIHQVLIDQLMQPGLAQHSQGVLDRLMDLTGFDYTLLQLSNSSLMVFVVIFLGAVSLALLIGPRLEPEEAFFIFSAVLVTGGLLAAPVWDLYYAYFDAPFLIGVLAFTFARLARALTFVIRRVSLSTATRRFSASALSLSAIVLGGTLAMVNVQFYQGFASTGLNPSELRAISTTIPPSSCVVYAYEYEGVYTNRLSPPGSSCPQAIDSYGMFQSVGMNVSHPPPAFVAEWKSYLARAKYVVLNIPGTPYLPWTTSLTSWFDAHFRLISPGPGVWVYRHRGM